MFTGIIRAVGVVDSASSRDGDLVLGIRAPGLLWGEQADGDSVAVNGVCLTIAQRLPDGFIADVSAETRKVTTLGGTAVGDRVNLELALALGERLGGHLVSGHVDCVGTVRRVERTGASQRLQIELPRDYRRYLAKKGSIAVDGVSLTINEVSDASFEVNIIPHTADNTITGGYRAGTRVNIEVDLVARYLESLLGQGSDGLSKEFLRAHGYA